MISKVKQLGPFHIFLTLSCGEAIWFDIFATVLKRYGYDVIFEEDENGEWDGDEDKITVEGKKLWDFVDSLNQTRDEILKKCTYIVTMHFEERVKSFIDNILLANGDGKVPIEYYSYRVEIQARGMPHIHLVAWIEKEFLESMGIHGDLADYKETVALADLLINCKLPDDEKFRKIVKDVQTHSHRRCKKKGGPCRFSYPKFPSKRTIIAKPFSKLSQSERELILEGESEEDFLQRSKTALTIGKKILEETEDLSTLT